MLTVRQRLTSSPAASEQLVLPFDLRQKSRLRTQLASGAEVGLFLERGIVLRGGDLLLAENGTVIEVVAALETVSTVREADSTQLARAGYHLGNRHVPVQIGDGWLRYGHDHVLDDMVRGLGLTVVVEQAPFEPEAGAYGHSHGTHGHEHGGAQGAAHDPDHGHHSHDHDHDHRHPHDHAHSHGGGESHEDAHSQGQGHAQGRAQGHGHERH